MSEEVQKYSSGAVIVNELTPDDVMRQVKSIQNLMSQAMHDGEHYGKIPGCGDKPALLKAGAEKLTFMFRLAPKYEIQEKDLGKGHREYRIVTELIHIPTGKSFGQGVGVCSTMESKFRFRNDFVDTGEGLPNDYKAKKDEYRKKGFVARKDEETGQWTWCKKQKVEYENPEDHYNTVLKMAKKRSLVDATLTSTAASDIFTQDVEELVENGVIDTPYSEVKEEKPKDRNYTAEAEACKTLDELAKWFKSLTPEEAKRLTGLKNDVKERLTKNGGKDILAMTINALTKDTYDRDHASIEKLIDDKPVEKKEFYASLYYQKLNELKIATDYVPLPI